MRLAPSAFGQLLPQRGSWWSAFFNTLPQLCWGRSRRGRGTLIALSFLLLTLPAFAVQARRNPERPRSRSPRPRNFGRGCAVLSVRTSPLMTPMPRWRKTCAFSSANSCSRTKSDEEVVDFVVERYGEFVLLKPRLKSSTLVLWASPFLILLAGLLFAFRRKTGSGHR